MTPILTFFGALCLCLALLSMLLLGPAVFWFGLWEYIGLLWLTLGETVHNLRQRWRNAQGDEGGLLLIGLIVAGVAGVWILKGV